MRSSPTSGSTAGSAAASRAATPCGLDPDLDRIRRQQELIAVILGDGFDFRRFLAPGLPTRISDDAAIAELSEVRWDWAYAMLAVVPAEIDGERVLIRESGPSG